MHLGGKEGGGLGSVSSIVNVQQVLQQRRHTWHKSSASPRAMQKQWACGKMRYVLKSNQVLHGNTAAVTQ